MRRKGIDPVLVCRISHIPQVSDSIKTPSEYQQFGQVNSDVSTNAVVSRQLSLNQKGAYDGKGKVGTCWEIAVGR